MFIRWCTEGVIFGGVSAKGDGLDAGSVCPVKDLQWAATALPFSVFIPHSAPNFADPHLLHFLETTPLSFHPAAVNGCDKASFLLCPSWTAEMWSVSTRGCQGLQAHPAPAVLHFSCLSTAANWQQSECQLLRIQAECIWHSVSLPSQETVRFYITVIVLLVSYQCCILLLFLLFLTDLVIHTRPKTRHTSWGIFLCIHSFILVQLSALLCESRNLPVLQETGGKQGEGRLWPSLQRPGLD